MVDSGWKSYRVENLIAAGAVVVNDGYRAKNSELSDGGLPFARAGNVNNGFDFRNADRFPVENIHRVGMKVSQSGDVLFTSKGTVGRFGFVREDTEQFVYSPQLCFWRVRNRSLIEPRFLYYWMHGAEFQEQCHGVKGQTDMADYVSLRDQRRMHITLPGLDVQRTIASVLGSLDDKIELNRRTNETLEEMARTLFKSWFVDFDPVRAKMEGRQPAGMDGETAALFPDSFEDSPLGEIPKGWSVESLDKVAHFLNGLALQKYPPDDDEYLPIIKIAELRKGVTASSGRASTKIPPQYVVEDGDVLFSWSGSLEVQLWTGGRGALNQHLFKVTSERYSKWFYYYWIKQHLPQFRAIAADKATTMGHIKRHHLTDALTVVPPEPTLRAMDAVMKLLVDKIVNNSLEARTLTAIRDALLPKLLSGEIRVRQAEEVVEETA